MKYKLRQLATTALVSVAVNSSPAAVRYVDVNSTSATPPYTNWTTAATNIQDAVDAAVAGDQILVTNGVYQTGGRFAGSDPGYASNRVWVSQAVRVESVNGPAVTSIVGYQIPGTTNGMGAVRCAYLSSGATLTGFTLTNGATALFDSGGGVFCASLSEVVSNCIIAGNSAASGGGSYRGTLQNCTLRAIRQSAQAEEQGTGAGPLSERLTTAC